MFWNNREQDKSILLAAGVMLIGTGIIAIFKPIFWFKADYVDFTGYNVQIGSALIIVGIGFIGVYFRKPRKS